MLRRAARRTDRTRVVAWQRIFVAGDRVVALADLERRVRSAPDAPARALPLRRATIALTRGHGRWLAVRPASGV